MADYLETYCENIETALEYYDGAKNEEDFKEWYIETYVHHAQVIYYRDAMDFLIENDVSLHDSMAKAQEYGMQPKDLNSETLASLLLQDILYDELYRLDLPEHFGDE